MHFYLAQLYLIPLVKSCLITRFLLSPTCTPLRLVFLVPMVHAGPSVLALTDTALLNDPILSFPFPIVVDAPRLWSRDRVFA